MKNEEVRKFLGTLLIHEIRPVFSLSEDEFDQAVLKSIYAYEETERKESLLSFLPSVPSFWDEDVFSLMSVYLDTYDILPEGMVFSLSAVIMALSGVRENKGRYEILQEEKTVLLPENAQSLRAFCSYSCDMPAEMLSYAVLHDRELWETEIPFLEQLESKVTEMLASLQILGVREALNGVTKRMTVL